MNIIEFLKTVVVRVIITWGNHQCEGLWVYTRKGQLVYPIPRRTDDLIGVYLDEREFSNYYVDARNIILTEDVGDNHVLLAEFPPRKVKL